MRLGPSADVGHSSTEDLETNGIIGNLINHGSRFEVLLYLCANGFMNGIHRSGYKDIGLAHWPFAEL